MCARAWNGTSTWRVPPPSASRATRAPSPKVNSRGTTPFLIVLFLVSTSILYPYSEQRLAPLELLEVRLRVRPEVRRQLVQ